MNAKVKKMLEDMHINEVGNRNLSPLTQSSRAYFSYSDPPPDGDLSKLTDRQVVILWYWYKYKKRPFKARRVMKEMERRAGA